jgi:hypothetical protein
VTVFERGVLWTRGRRQRSVHWDDVTDVTSEVIDGEYVLTVTTRDGRDLVFDDSLANVRQLHGYFINATRGRDG